MLVMTGDFVALKDRGTTTHVCDMTVFDLIALARDAGLRTGVVLKPSGGAKKLEQAIKRLEKKVEAGAQFAVTQPMYDTASTEMLLKQTAHLEIPIVLGILPLRTPRHAEFLHQRVAGIDVPESVRERMALAKNSIAEGAVNAR